MGAYEQMMKQEEVRIPQMDLEQIKTMLCPISNHDPLKCVGCKSLSGCPAGQRANVLLEEATKQKMIKQGIRPNNIARVAKARELCVTATKTGNPVSYLMKTFGSSHNTAWARVLGWEKAYPDLMKGIDWRTKAKQEDGKSEEAYGNLETAIKSGDVYNWYVKNFHMPRSRVEKIMENGFKARPELKELYDRMQENQDDEISLEDFLKDIPENGEETAVEQPSEVEVKEIPTEEEKPVETEKKAAFGKTVVEIELEQKYKQIESEKKKVTEQIEELGERLKWLDSQQEALETVRKMFAQSTETGKSPITE